MKPSSLAGFLVTFAFILPAASGAQIDTPFAKPLEPPAKLQPATIEGQNVAPINPVDKPSLELRADILMARKQFSEAIDIYEEILNANPRNAAVLNRVGIAYHQLGDLDKARKYYERSYRADRTYAHAVNNIGMTDYDRKKFRGAVKWYLLAIQLSPDTASFHSNLGHAYFQQKKYDEALGSIRRALELDPELFEHRSAFGSILLQRQVTERGAYHYFIARTFAALGNPEQCARYLLRARDEGFKNISSVRSDPAFSSIINHPRVVEVLDIISPQTSSVVKPRS